LRKMVRAQHLGVKSGQGFFRYDSDGKTIPMPAGGEDKAT
jgi:3-hydroxyacyl-CoA dehydrogenase